MKTIEERLQAHKQNLNNLQAPPELEDRLRHALIPVPAKKRRKNRAATWAATAAAALLLFIGTYQYPAFAYYGGKLFNKVELASLSFAEVAEQGYGQTVNKSRTLDDGSVITVNGVIADDNALLMYYTIVRPEGASVLADNGSPRYNTSGMKGFLTDSLVKEGSGNFSADKTRFYGVDKFEPVSPFSRTLTVTFFEWQDNGKRASYPISFKFKANQAMRSLLKEDIAKSVPVDGGSVHYDTITASPTSTVVKGHYELKGEEYPPFPGQTKLYVNGTEVKSWGMRSENAHGKGRPQFELEYDVLPTDKPETVELVLENFAGYQDIAAPLSLASPSDRSITIGSEKLWIRSVARTAKGYDVVIARKQFTLLDTEHLSVQAGGKTVPVSAISPPRPWDLKNGNILWEQTYSFPAAEKPEQLLLEGFHYIKAYGEKVSIPVAGTE